MKCDCSNIFTLQDVIHMNQPSCFLFYFNLAPAFHAFLLLSTCHKFECICIAGEKSMKARRYGTQFYKLQIFLCSNQKHRIQDNNTGILYTKCITYISSDTFRQESLLANLHNWPFNYVWKKRWWPGDRYWSVTVAFEYVEKGTWHSMRVDLTRHKDIMGR
jgi:hypothetical protein